MWFWTECSNLIGSERLYIPHSLNKLHVAEYRVLLPVRNGVREGNVFRYVPQPVYSKVPVQAPIFN